MKRMLLAACAAMSLAACQSKIDTSNPAAYTTSIQKMTKDMTPTKKAEFQQAMVAVAFDTADPTTGIFSQADPSAPIFLGAGDKIKGKTADEIIRLGYESRIAALDKGIAEDIAAVQRVKAERAKYQNVFDNVHIDGARYHVSSTGYSEDPILSFTVTNGSKMPIKTLYLHGTLTSPGRSIPWVSADINYDFPGGLEAGENEHLDLAPNMFGDWKVDDRYSRRPDLVLKLDVTNLKGADDTDLIQSDPGSVAEKQAAAATKQKTKVELEAKLKALK